MERESGGNRALISDSKLAIVILAAGKGKRLKSQRAKVLHEVGGKPLLAHVIAAASKIVAPSDIFAVIGHQAEQVRTALGKSGVNFVEQRDQRGTGHAVQSARDAISGYENVIVLSGDAPLVRPETIEELCEFHQAEHAAMTLVSAEPEQSTGYGRVIRKSTDSYPSDQNQSPGTPSSSEVVAIVEQKMLNSEQLSLREVNMGMYAFRTAPLLAHLGELAPDNPHGELYLTDMAAVLHRAGERVVALKTDDANELLGANTIAELVALDASLRMATVHRLMDSGVTIFRPETCTIDAEVEVGPDTVIEPFVQLLGRTRVGSDCLIRSYTVVENCTVGNKVILRQSCVLAESSIADGADIGPFARMRPGCEIGEQVHIGNFVEVKKSKLGKGVKAGHLAYLGDSEIGAAANIGAGVITCNYDGQKKHLTRIGAGSFVGSDSTLVAPLTIGDGTYIAAGSCITHDVPADALAVARARQVIKEGWAAARRAKNSEKK
ncbi:MAG: bifunctional UDP-N-acetylglucosamine diphosphorylase/glucosamine-1-phosphate N-acetyltransferase GlmU [Terracidiphilus sp.]